MSELPDAVPAFSDLGVCPELLGVLRSLGIETPTPIQQSAVPIALDGRDVVGRARTGSGKTLAFGLPLVQRLGTGAGRPTALVLAPTRELALQVSGVLKKLAAARSLSVLCIYGGTPYPPQLKALRSGVDVVVGTPGRTRDLFERGALDLGGVRIAVLDEADEMLRLGFVDDVSTLLNATQADRQVLLFSASMSPEMRGIASTYLRDPVELQVEDEALTVHHIDQRWMRVPAAHKLDTVHRVLAEERRGAALVFASTRIGCVELADGLSARGLDVDALHGGLGQDLRERVVRRVRSGTSSVLVATDVAARGIDIAHVGLVVNYDIPESAERYVHRIGRTARAGRAGVAVTLVTPKQKRRLRELAHELGADITQVQIPTGGAVMRSRRAALLADLGSADESELVAARALVARLAAEGSSAEEVAASALALLAAQRGVPLDDAEDEALPSWVRPVADPRALGEDLNQVQLCVGLGKRGGVRATDVVRALVEQVGVPATSIGRVRLQKERSLVGLPREVAERVLSECQQLSIGGEDVALTRSDG